MVEKLAAIKMTGDYILDRPRNGNGHGVIFSSLSTDQKIGVPILWENILVYAIWEICFLQSSLYSC
jgi:hypothetical protein